MAREFKAFVRAKKVVRHRRNSCVSSSYIVAWTNSLREVAGIFTALHESITDQATAERLRACGPVERMLRQMLPLSAVDALPQGLRLVVIDASSIQAPGAKGTDHRLHIAMDLVSRSFSAYWSAMSTRVKHSNISPASRGMWSWQTAAMPSAKACVWRSSRGPSSSYGSIPLAWSRGRGRRAVGAERRLETPEDGNAAHAGGDPPRGGRPA